MELFIDYLSRLIDIMSMLLVCVAEANITPSLVVGLIKLDIFYNAEHRLVKDELIVKASHKRLLYKGHNTKPYLLKRCYSRGRMIITYQTLLIVKDRKNA